MAEFKKSMFGGYKKKQVEETLSQLRKDLEESSARELSLKEELLSAKEKIAATDEGKLSELKNRTFELSEEVKRLTEENIRLQKENFEIEKQLSDISKSKADSFANISKVYMRAYNSGHDIATDSKNVALSFLDNLTKEFNDAKVQSDKIVKEYEKSEGQISSLINLITECLKKNKRDTSMLVEKVKAISELYSQFDAVKNSLSAQADEEISKYDTAASEFLLHNERESEPLVRNYTKTETAEATETDNSSQVTENAPEKDNYCPPQKEETENAETTVTAEELNTTIENSKKTDTDITETASERTAVNPVVTIKDIEDSETEKPLNTSVFSKNTVHNIHNQIEEKNRQKNSGFTQHGPKSKLTPEERQELIRKAMLKYSGNN